MNQIPQRVRLDLADEIKPKIYEAVRSDDMEKAVGLSEAAGLIRDQKPKRKKTGYIVFMADCMKQNAKAKNMGEAQEKVKVCAINWKGLNPQQKAQFKAKADMVNRGLG